LDISQDLDILLESVKLINLIGIKCLILEMFTHISLFSYQDLTTDIVGLPISAYFLESDKTFLNDEWFIKGNHFSKDAVSNYLSFHKSLYLEVNSTTKCNFEQLGR